MTPDTEARPDEPRTAIQTPPGTRLILTATDLLDTFAPRTDLGDRISAEWGEPSPEGWYTPTFTVHSDDNIVERGRSEVRDELRERVAGLRKSQLKPGDTNSWTESYRMGWNALLDAVLALLSESQP